MNFRRSAISIALLIAAFSLPSYSSDNDSDINRADQNPQAKNVILMITDGSSWGTWDMASYWEYGERGRQPYDQFDVKLGMITPPLNTSKEPTYTGTPQVTYTPERAWDTTPVDTTTRGYPNYFAGYEYLKEDYTDSAAAGTVLSTGQKTYNNAIDYDDFAQPLTFITQEIREQGKATGVVSSVPLSHATPAAFSAQNISRHNYGEIANFMVQRDHLDLIMGGGHPEYDSDGQLRSEPRYANEEGSGGGYIPRTIWEGLRNGTAGGDHEGHRADRARRGREQVEELLPAAGVRAAQRGGNGGLLRFVRLGRGDPGTGGRGPATRLLAGGPTGLDGLAPGRARF